MQPTQRQLKKIRCLSFDEIVVYCGVTLAKLLVDAAHWEPYAKCTSSFEGVLIGGATWRSQSSPAKILFTTGTLPPLFLNQTTVH